MTRPIPAMPNAPEFYAPEPAPDCTQCGEPHNGDSERCAVRGCWQTELCTCCRTKCVDCGRTFCMQHMDACGCSDIRIAKEEEAA